MEIIALLQNFATPWLDKLFLLITNIGSEKVYICLLLVTYLAIDSRIAQRLGVYFLLGYYLNFHLKALFSTPRPFEIDESVLRGEAGETALGGGFPSGHAQASMTFWGLIAFSFQKRWLYLLCALIIVLISLSRIYLGVHFPIDVLGGLFIGGIIVALGLSLNPYLNNFTIKPMLLLLIGIAIPFLLHLLLPVTGSGQILGSLAAFITGPSILKHRTDGAIVPRFITALLGIVLVFGVLIGSSLLVPENIKDNTIFGFFRYFIIGYVGILFTPWLAKRFGLI